jgi:hypothetical protein
VIWSLFFIDDIDFNSDLDARRPPATLMFVLFVTKVTIFIRLFSSSTTQLRL